MRSTVLLAAILAIAATTKPGVDSFRRALHAFVRRQQGLLGEALSRGALALSDLAGASAGNAGALLACDDFYLFSVIRLDASLQCDLQERGTLVGTLRAVRGVDHRLRHREVVAVDEAQQLDELHLVARGEHVRARLEEGEQQRGRDALRLLVE